MKQQGFKMCDGKTGKIVRRQRQMHVWLETSATPFQHGIEQPDSRLERLWANSTTPNTRRVYPAFVKCSISNNKIPIFSSADRPHQDTHVLSHKQIAQKFLKEMKLTQNELSNYNGIKTKSQSKKDREIANAWKLKKPLE